VVFE
ncbi:hypothetical protein CISIN_1g0463802mg, partial [Citrus sinensis]